MTLLVGFTTWHNAHIPGEFSWASHAVLCCVPCYSCDIHRTLPSPVVRRFHTSSVVLFCFMLQWFTLKSCMVKRLNPIFNLKKKVLCGWIQTLELSVQKVQHSTNRFDEHEGNMEFSVQRSGSLGVSQPLSPLQCLARQAIHPQKLGRVLNCATCFRPSDDASHCRPQAAIFNRRTKSQHRKHCVAYVWYSTIINCNFQTCRHP